MGGEANTIHGFIYKSKIYICGFYRSGRVSLIGVSCLEELIECAENNDYDNVKSKIDSFMYVNCDKEKIEIIGCNNEIDTCNEEIDICNVFYDDDDGWYPLKNDSNKNEFDIRCENYKNEMIKKHGENYWSGLYGLPISSIKMSVRAGNIFESTEYYLEKNFDLTEYKNIDDLCDKLNNSSYIDYAYLINFDNDTFLCATSCHFHIEISVFDIDKLKKMHKIWSNFRESNNH